jgi:hypothetical protein
MLDENATLADVIRAINEDRRLRVSAPEIALRIAKAMAERVPNQHSAR